MAAEALIGGLAQMAFNVAGAALENQLWESNYQTQLAGQKELMNYALEKNSPSEQMRRLELAGLNPNLVYGSAAPAGTTGNVPSSPGGYSPSFNTPDIAAMALQMAEAKAQTAGAQRNIAEANWLNKQSGRYDEIVDSMIKQHDAQINELNSRLDLNASNAELNRARTYLSQAQKLFTEGQISLQDYEKKRMIAETALFRSSSNLNNKKATTEEYLAETAKEEAVITKLEAEYKRLFLDPDSGKAKELSAAEYKAAVQKYETEARVAAADAQIYGSKVARWVEWSFDRFGTLFGIAKNFKELTKK